MKHFVNSIKLKKKNEILWGFTLQDCLPVSVKEQYSQHFHFYSDVRNSPEWNRRKIFK